MPAKHPVLEGHDSPEQDDTTGVESPRLYRRLLEPIGNISPVELELAYYRQLEESAMAA